MTYLETIILYCLDQINNERSIYSIFHLLNGKKSSQTIQDAHFFKLDKLFQTFPSLNRDEFNDKIFLCQKLNLVTEADDQHYILSNEGKSTLIQQLAEKPLPPFLNGWKYHSLTSVFWERLSLLVQVCSNLVHHHTEYLPIQRRIEVQYWVKYLLQHLTKNREDIANQLYKELIACFDDKPQLDPAILVIRLTGYKNVGLTSQQAAHVLNLEQNYYQLQFLNQLHFLIDEIHVHPKQYPLLSLIISDLSQPASFTISTSKTYQWIKKGFGLDEIAKLRNLKRSTVEDHFVEIALIDKTFDITNLVPAEKQQMILAAAKKSTSKQLKSIRELTNDTSYFEIRLVLAKFGDSKWN